MWKTRCKTGAVVEDELVRFGTIFDRFLEYPVLFPEFEDSFFHGRKINFGINGLVHLGNSMNFGAYDITAAHQNRA
jgi:hypothetical protein